MDRIELNTILCQLVEMVRIGLKLSAVQAVSIVMRSKVVSKLERGLWTNPTADQLYHSLITELNTVEN